MNCHDASLLKHAWADGELDVVRTMDIEQHLESCAACALAFENVRALKSAVKSDELYFRAPAGLERGIRARLRLERERAPGPRPAWWQWLKFAVPTAGVAFALGLLVFPLSGPSAEERLGQEVTSSHVRSLMAEHKTDVASSDRHTVKPWFNGKLDFAPPVIDLAEHGFPLVGGRLDYLQNRAVAALVYQRHQHFINLFIWPAASESASPLWERAWRGYNLVHWTRAGMTFWAVSDLNGAELKQFAVLFSGGS